MVSGILRRSRKLQSLGQQNSAIRSHHKICKMFCFTWLRGVFQWYIVRGKNENHFYENNTIRAWLRKK